ncbi:MAG TPA: hypothetical protein DCO72_01410 [Ruminococcus sp.]|nr:hypothetical protein [Ruminococcus sp.]
MRYWTVQTRDVVEQIHENGIFEPDFKKSRYINKINSDLSELYDFILQSFNHVNHMSLSGVVFAFTAYKDSTLYILETIEDFQKIIRWRAEVIGGLWRNFDPNNHVVLEVEYLDDFNPVYMDINDFQFMMPPVRLLPPYSSDFSEKFRQNVSSGIFTESPLPSGLLQVHLPYIKEENLIAVHDFFSL